MKEKPQAIKIKSIYVFETSAKYSGGLRFIIAKNKKEAIDKIAAEKYNNFPGWQYIGTFKQFENIIRKQKDIEYYYGE